MAKKSFGAQLTDAVRAATASLKEEIGDEKLCAFALYTSGQEGFDYVCASACTEEGLARAVASSKARRKKQGRDTSDEELESALRWSPGDWEQHDFSPEVSAIKLPPRDEKGDDKRDAAIYAAFVKALKTADEEGLFGKGAKRTRLTLAILCGDMSAEFLLKGIKRLNPPAVVKRYVDAHTPASLYARLDKLPLEERLTAYLSLYVDLAFRRATPDTARAKQVGLTYFGQLEEKIAELGPAAVEGYLEILEREHAFKEAFHERGSDAWKKYGAPTPAMQVTTSAVFAIGEIGNLSEALIARLVAVLKKRSALDEERAGTVSTLAENIARVLHALNPGRFVAPKKDPKTNRLLNPGDYR